MSDEQIDSRVSIDFFPGQVEGRILKDVANIEQARQLAAPVVRVLGEIHQNIGKLHDAREALTKDRTRTEEAVAVELQKLSDRIHDIAAKRIGSQDAALGKGIEHLENELSAPVVATAARPVAAEIRAHLKSLSTGQRLEQIRQAIVDGDETVASAVLGAPAMLSGLDKTMHQTLLTEWHKRTKPDKAETLAILKRSRELMSEVAFKLNAELAKAVGAERGAAAAWAANAAEATRAIQAVIAEQREDLRR